MTTEPIVISKKSLLTYPNLENFLSGNQKNLTILTDPINTKYELVLNNMQPIYLSIFQAICLYGKHKELNLFKLDNKVIKEAVKENDYYSIRCASINGNTDTIKYLGTYLTNKEKIESIKANDYDSIQLSALYGNIDTIKYLETYLTNEEIKEAAYRSIPWAAVNGHTEIIKYLGTYLSYEEKRKVIKDHNYLAIQVAAENGNIDTIKYLESYLTNKEKIQAAKADSFSSIRKAAENGYIDTIKYLESYLTYEEKRDAVKMEDYDMILWTAGNGHTETIKYLETYLTNEEKISAVRAGDYFSIRLAIENGHMETASYLLRHVNAFSYMEKHDMEYGQDLIYPFVATKLDTLAREKDAFEQNNPNGVFNLDEEKAQFCFFLLRNLIRRGVDRNYGNENREAEDLVNEIRFLLSIPSVRALCHQKITVDEDSPGQENELLKLAISLNNQAATQLLMQFPEVRRLAEQNNYYRNDVQGGLNLREIAQDNESSMVALTPTEEKMLKNACNIYQNDINKQGGTEAVFGKLKHDLKKRYEANPARLELTTSNGELEIIELPFEWDELQDLKKCLTKKQYQLALEAYHKHDVHTAYRYLSKPNYWMANNASFVYVLHNQNGELTNLRYATFEEYKSMIALFYTAVNDEKTPAIDGYTLQGRKGLFIKQLALIGRAHNWDTGIDSFKNGDKPSCYSGVKRRLFQSVLGHSLFKVITKDILIQALNEQIKVYFERIITDKNCVDLQKAYDGLVTLDGDVNEHLKTLNTIDIPKKTKQQMIEKVCSQLSLTYKNQFDDQTRLFVSIMERYFKNARIAGCDFCGLQGPIGLEDILKDRIKHKLQEQPLNSPKSPNGFFKELAWKMKANELSEHRHQSNEHQRAYDKHCGLVKV